MTDADATIPPPPPAPVQPAPAPSRSRRGRPGFAYVIAAVIGLRVFREVLEWVAFSQWGILGFIAVGLAAITFVLAWRIIQRQRVRARGGIEHTPEMVAKQLMESELLPPAFDEDGTISGASILVLNQQPKVLEVETQYEVFGSNGEQIGTITQIGQSRGKQIARVLTTFDQFFTHHFEMRDLDGRSILRLTRPAKLFRSRVNIFDDQDRYLGSIRQENIFWKIRFQLVDPADNVVGYLRAANVRAWDFHVEDAWGHEVATVVKSWEGWGRSAWTRADRYVLKVHRSLPLGLRELVLAVPLTIDVALKQDVRGFG